jgi:hypothetical protein
MLKLSKGMWSVLGAIALAGASSLLIPSNGNEHATFENFEKIKEGMTIEEVTAILGQATHIDRYDHSTFMELLSAIFGAPPETHRYSGETRCGL